MNDLPVDSEQPLVYNILIARLQVYFTAERKPVMKTNQGSSTREAWILCLILGIIMLNFPFIQIFNSDEKLLGIPILVLYFFIGWPLSILVIYLFTCQLERDEKNSTPEDDQIEL